MPAYGRGLPAGVSCSSPASSSMHPSSSDWMDREVCTPRTISTRRSTSASMPGSGLGIAGIERVCGSTAAGRSRAAPGDAAEKRTMSRSPTASFSRSAGPIHTCCIGQAAVPGAYVAFAVASAPSCGALGHGAFVTHSLPPGNATDKSSNAAFGVPCGTTIDHCNDSGLFTSAFLGSTRHSVRLTSSAARCGVSSSLSCGSTGCSSLATWRVLGATITSVSVESRTATAAGCSPVSGSVRSTAKRTTVDALRPTCTAIYWPVRAARTCESIFSSTSSAWMLRISQSSACSGVTCTCVATGIGGDRKRRIDTVAPSASGGEKSEASEGPTDTRSLVLIRGSPRTLGSALRPDQPQ